MRGETNLPRGEDAIGLTLDADNYAKPYNYRATMWPKLEACEYRGRDGCPDESREV